MAEGESDAGTGACCAHFAASGALRVGEPLSVHVHPRESQPNAPASSKTELAVGAHHGRLHGWGKQAPDCSADIATFTKDAYDVTFPLFEKIDLNGSKAARSTEFIDVSNSCVRAWKRQVPGGLAPAAGEDPRVTRTAVGAHEVRVLAEVPACPSCNFYTDIEYGRAVATVVAGQPNTVDVALDGNVGVVTGSLSVNGTGASDLAISLRLRRACRAARAALVFAIRSGLAAVRRIAG